MGLPRIQHWELHLHNYLTDHRTTSFEWGSFDCGLFAAGAIQAVTGVDVGKPFKDLNYDSLLTASKAILHVTGTGSGINDAAEYIARTHNLQSIPVLFAQRADLVLYEGEEGWAAGVLGLDGRHVFFAGTTGLRKVSLRVCSQKGRAWRVA